MGVEVEQELEGGPVPQVLHYKRSAPHQRRGESMVARHGAIRSGLALVFVLCLVPQLAFAQFEALRVEAKDLPGKIRVGPVRVHPYVGVKGTYTDNFFLTDSNEEEDWIGVFVPGITVHVPYKDRHLLELDYHAEIIRHSDFTHYDREDHHASGLLEFKFPWGLDLKLADRYKQSATPPDFEGDTKDTYHYNDALIEAAYRLADRYTVKVNYRNVIKDFFASENEDDNFVRNGGSVGLYYRIFPKTNILAEYTYYHMDNEGVGPLSTDNDNHHAWAGLEWEPGAKIKGGIKGGYTARRYDELGTDEDVFGIEGDLTYLLSSFTSFHLQLERQIIQTEATRGESIYGTHYIRTGGKLGVTYKFPFFSRGMHDLSTTLEGFYYNGDYRERGTAGRKRDDDVYGGSAQLKYTFWERLAVIVRYRYQRNDSNFDIEEHKENRVYAEMFLVF